MSGPFSGLTPQGLYTRRVLPGQIVGAADADDLPVRLTMAAVDPHSAVDKKKTPSTLRLVPQTVSLDEDGEERQDEPVVLCTLAPGVQYQQPLDLTIFSEEAPLFQLVGSYPIDVSGNFIGIAEGSDDDEDDEDDEDFSGSEDGSGSEDDDSEDEDDLDMSDDEDISERIVEIADGGSGDDDSEEESSDSEEESSDSEEEVVKEKIERNNVPQKRRAEEAKNDNKVRKEAKKVEFAEKLEKPASATESKYPTKKLEGGVVVEDHKLGNGQQAKRGNRIAMRYIGKLKNGKVFDKNTSGKPFYFKLGAGEVIRGWDVGVAGMAVGGERRIIIPAPMAYGKASLPGIPANSELLFDVKLLSIK